jgi:molecular chaperone GrpE
LIPKEPEAETNNQSNQTPAGEVEPEAVELEDVDSLKEALAETRAKAEANLAGWQRAQADFINYKKRTEQEKEDLSKFANSPSSTKRSGRPKVKMGWSSRRYRRAIC